MNLYNIQGESKVWVQPVKSLMTKDRSFKLGHLSKIKK